MPVIAGTCGYDYAEWVGAGRFYPPGLAGRRSEWLTYYASRFKVAELNFTYYGETNPKQLESMLARISPTRELRLLEGDYRPQADFQFTIKAYAALTHEITLQWMSSAARFLHDIEPLLNSGKLLGVLAQFPSRYHVSAEALHYVLELAEALQPAQLITEFRHADWLRAKPRAELWRHGVVVCGIDAPRAAGMPSVFRADESALTGNDDQSWSVPFRYLRLHGRREETWWTGDAAARYDYAYTPHQVEQLAQVLLATSVERTYAMFNNHRQANAAKNALQLEDIINKLLQPEK